MSEKRFYLGNNDTTICDRSQGGSDGFNMLTIFKVVDLLNEQQATIQSLKERLYDFEKRKIIEESSIDEDVIPRVKLLRAELFGEKYE